MKHEPGNKMAAINDKTHPQSDILILDDEIANLKLLGDFLTQQGYKVRPAEMPQLAIDSAIAQPPVLILLDVRMPEMDGFEVCRRLKQDERTCNIPIIFISALHETDDKVQAFKAGGVDYITKPFQEEEVLARVRTHLELRNMQLNLAELVAKRTAELETEINDRKQAKKELAKSEAKYRGLVDNSLVGIFTSTLDGRFTFVNGAMAKIFNFDSTEQMIARGSLERWSDQTDRERMLAKLQKHGSVTNFEAETITHTDRHIHALFSAKKIGNDIYGMVMDITELQEAYAEIRQLQSQLEAESAYLQEEIKLEHNFENIIGQSDALEYVLNRIEMVAPQDSTVIILGETGTGKELVARALHQLSPRSKRPLVKVNCAALPAELIESELFGREKGAFTGATTTQVGRFELADKSTLFLDEIGELPLELQAKLLRVLESGEFERLGSPRTLHSDARIITATNRDLEEEVRNKRFREDLWYRLKIFPITIPPLRDRIEDIPLLVDHFVQLFSRKMGKKPTSLKITKSSMQALQSYPWPGNVRELKHVVESALITSVTDRLNFDLPEPEIGVTRKLKTFEEMEREYILEVLKVKNWKIKGKDSASSILGLPPSTLRHRIKKLGLKKP
jgi:PAS domain S-box-containing protein